MAQTGPEPYVLAARFTDEQSSGKAYSQAESLAFHTDGDLSVYRLQLNNFWYVGIVGIAPGKDLDRQLQVALADGEPVEQPTEQEADMLDFLWQRRAEAMMPGGWVEHHYRPGQRVVKTKFDLGTVVMTRGVQAALERHPEEKGLQELEHIILNRHAQGDWGELDKHDLNMNEDALKNGGRLFSVYYLEDGTERGTKIYVITEWDRSVSTVLLPDEY